MSEKKKKTIRQKKYNFGSNELVQENTWLNFIQGTGGDTAGMWEYLTATKHMVNKLEEATKDFKTVEEYQSFIKEFTTERKDFVASTDKQVGKYLEKNKF